MSALNQACSISDIQSGDKIRLYDTSNGDWRDSSIATLTAYIQANITVGKPVFNKEFSAPSATGFTVAVTDTSDNAWLILTPTAGFAAGTITLPAVANAIDNQEVLVNCTQVVTTLTIDGNGATAVTGEPTTLAANDFFKLKYEAVTKTWYRVG